MEQRVIKPEDYLKQTGTKGLVLWFYPKAGTMGCSMEAAKFNKTLADFQNLGFNVVGVSIDDEADNEQFSKEQDLHYPLVSDPDKKLVEQFKVWGEKSKFGLETWAVIRSTFALDPQGNILWEGRDVNPTEHIDQLLEELKKF